MLLFMDVCAVEGGCRALRTGKDNSFKGGGGTFSDCRGPLSPRGPRGPSPSSTFCSRVGCASTRRGVLGVRGPLAVGDFRSEPADSGAGVEEADLEASNVLLESGN